MFAGFSYPNAPHVVHDLPTTLLAGKQQVDNSGLVPRCTHVIHKDAWVWGRDTVIYKAKLSSMHTALYDCPCVPFWALQKNLSFNVGSTVSIRERPVNTSGYGQSLLGLSKLQCSGRVSVKTVATYVYTRDHIVTMYYCPLIYRIFMIESLWLEYENYHLPHCLRFLVVVPAIQKSNYSILTKRILNLLPNDWKSCQISGCVTFT